MGVAMEIGKRARRVILGVAAATLVFVLGAYGGAIAGGERGGFTMNFPAEGAEAGGPSPRDLTGIVVVSLDRTGFIKRALQRDVIEVTAHVITNVGDKPYRIRFETGGFVEDMEWHSRDRDWNPDTHEIERDIAPGDSVDLGLTVHLPDPLPAGAVPVSGTIYIVDAVTGERLSKLPVAFTRTGSAAVGDCCE